MILRREGDRVLGVTQTAHSALTGRLAEAWRPIEGLPWDELCTAALVHDVGWAPWEQAPTTNPSTGLPYAFYEMPDDEYAEIWARGTDAAQTFGRLVGLLVSRHFTRLAGRREGLRALLDRESARQATLQSELGLDPPIVERCSDMLAMFDGVSLQLCAGEEVRITPWPFDRVLEVAIDARELPDGSPETLDIRLDEPPAP